MELLNQETSETDSGRIKNVGTSVGTITMEIIISLIGGLHSKEKEWQSVAIECGSI
jgi:hypothetical protein